MLFVKGLWAATKLAGMSALQVMFMLRALREAAGIIVGNNISIWEKLDSVDIAQK